MLYPCFCTRREIQAEIARAGGAPHGAGRTALSRHLPRPRPRQRAARQRSGADYALRLDVARAMALTGPLDWFEEEEGRAGGRPALLGDVVLARKEMPASYHLAVTVDDAIQGVTLVTRGDDLVAGDACSSSAAGVLGLPTPRYRHHKLLTDPPAAASPNATGR